jgi:hypothetical protein
MQVTKSDAREIMQKLNIVEINCEHHYAGYLVEEGTKILKVHYSNGDGVMPIVVAHLFRRSLKLSVPEFQALLDGKLSRESYIDRLREQGLIPELKGAR